MTFHQGTPLVSSVYLSNHFLNLRDLTLSPSLPPLVEHILVPYLHGLRLCLHIVWYELIRGNLFDGEDFTSDTAGLWERGKEWKTPSLGRTFEPGGNGDEVYANADNAENEPQEEQDEAEWTVEDVFDRIDASLAWLETQNGESDGLWFCRYFAGGTKDPDHDQSSESCQISRQKFRTCRLV